MSVTFNVVKKVPGLVGYQFLYPYNFDATPVVDPEMPEYGPIVPENPLSLNVSNMNGLEILRHFSITTNENTLSSGGLLDPLEIIETCEQILATLRSIPEMDYGTETVVTKNEFGPTWIKCGHLPGWYQNRFSKLLEMAEFAFLNGAVICYA